MQVILIFTPFQLRQLELVKKEHQYSIDPDVIYFANIKEESLKKLVSSRCKLIEVDLGSLRFKEILKSPFEEIYRIRKILKDYKSGFKNLNLTNELDLIIGSEKDLFTQFLIHFIVSSNRSLKLTAIEEGLGYYGDLNIKDRYLKLLYKTITPVLLKFKYNYFRVLGTHPKISTVFVRFPNQLSQIKGKKYIKIEGKQAKEYFPKGEVLLLTSPLYEDKYCRKEEELELIESIVNVIESYGLSISHKAHPRELENKVEKYTLNAENISQEIVAEKIDYSNFKSIINFNSSVIIDIFESEYPMNKVITVEMFDNISNSFLNNLFNAGKVIKKGTFSAEDLEKSLMELLAI